MECGPEASSLQVSYLYFSSLRCGGKSLKGSAAYPAEFGNWVADHVASSVAWWNWIGGIVFFLVSWSYLQKWKVKIHLSNLCLVNNR